MVKTLLCVFLIICMIAMPVVRDGDTAKDSKVWLQAIQHIFSDKYCWLLKVIIKIVMNINTSCCVWSSSCRFVLWRRHFFSRAATVVHMSLLWQDGLHRDILTGACHLRAFRDFHGGGEYTHCTNGTAQYTFVYYYKLRNVLISLSILVYLCYPLACSEFSHHCNSQLLHFSYSVAFYEHSPLLSKARQRLRLLILLTPGCLVGCLTNSYLRAGVKRCHWSVWPELTYYLT